MQTVCNLPSTVLWFAAIVATHTLSVDAERCLSRSSWRKESTGTRDHSQQCANISELYHQCFFAKGEYRIKQLTRCSLNSDLLTRQSCGEEFLKCAAAAWIHSSLRSLPEYVCQDLSLLLIVLISATDSVNLTKLGNRKRTFQRNRVI